MTKLFAVLSFLLILNGVLLSQEKTDSLLALAQSTNDTSRVDALNQLCWRYRNSDPQKAIQYGEAALKTARAAQYHKGVADAMSFVGVAYRNTGNHVKALNLYFDLIKYAENNNNKEGLGYGYINIGNIYIYQKKYSTALKYLDKALDIAEKLKNKHMQAYALLNSGRVYTQTQNYTKALRLILEARQIRQQLGDQPGIGVCLRYAGDVHLEQKKYEKALDFYSRSLQLIRQNKSNDLDLMADLNNQIAQCYLKSSLPVEALSFATNSRKYAMQVGSLLRIANANQTLAQINHTLGNHNSAYQLHKLYAAYKDSFLNEKNAQQIAELQTIYDTEKKQQEIELLNREKKIQRIVIYSLILVFAIIGIFSLLLYKQRNQISAQRDIVTAQKQSITDSIQYASRIQNAVLPPKELIQSILPEHFILYKPRDIVSGDFYWLAEKKQKLILAAADCTGHGVPGAFMSMLGIAFLNDIVNKNPDQGAALILNKLRNRVIKSLHQTGKENEAKDGMDIALCIIDRQTRQLQFAGAYNPIYIVRNTAKKPPLEADKSLEKQTLQLAQFNGDRMPIGIYARTSKEFRQKEIQLQPGDTIYMFSDGYIDQFGGKTGRKFLAKNLKKTFLNINDKPLDGQKQFLEEKIQHWKGKYEQIDDMLIVGFKMP